MDALRAGLIASIIGGLLGLASVAAAKDFVVTKRGDPAPKACKPRDCSLREAVIAANERAPAPTGFSSPRRGPTTCGSRTPVPATRTPPARATST